MGRTWGLLLPRVEGRRARRIFIATQTKTFDNGYNNSALIHASEHLFLFYGSKRAALAGKGVLTLVLTLKFWHVQEPLPVENSLVGGCMLR